jgi:hypothetical protein
MSSNEDNTSKKEPDYSDFGYDFFGHDFKLPGEICMNIFEITREFKKKEWYTHEEIYDLSGGILNNIWLDPDNPNEVIYIDFQAYDNHDVTRELIRIDISEIRYGGQVSILKFLENSNTETNEESDKFNEGFNEGFNEEFNEEFNEGFNEGFNEEFIEGFNEEIVRKENIISYSNYNRSELRDRFLYSRLFLGYDYKSIINDYGEKHFKLLPVKNKVLSLKTLCIRNIRLWITDQLDLIKYIDKYEIILEPLTLIGEFNMGGYSRKWIPELLDFNERFLQNQPQYIKDMLQLYKF